MHIYWGTIHMSCPWVSEDDSFLISKQGDKSCLKDMFQPNLYNLFVLNLIVSNVTSSQKFQISFCLKECKCFKSQYCALPVSVGCWCLFFTLGRLQNPHRNHMLGTLDVTGSEPWTPFSFS